MPTRTGSPALLIAVYDRLLALCDSLETIADSLPRHVDPQLCRDSAAGLAALLQETHRLEGIVLFPEIIASGSPSLLRTADRLHAEHIADGAAAGEVIAVLNSLAERRQWLSYEAIGYLLRAFFDRTRRHILTERDILERLAPTRRTATPVH